MKKQNGYTLLEMMISISIFLMIMLTVGMGSISIQKTWSRVQKHSANLKVYQMLDRVFSPSFKNAVPFNWRDGDGATKAIFVGEQSLVTFAYLHRMNRLSEGGIRFLKIYLDNEKLIAAYRNTPLLYWDENDDNVQVEVLAENINAVNFNYAYLENNELTWTDVWEEHGYKIPIAIQVTVEWSNGDSETWLRRTAGNGFKQQLSIRN